MILYDENNVPIINIDVDDTSYRYRSLMGSDSLLLQFSLTEHIEFPVGTHCTFENDTYELMNLTNVTVHHRRNYEYKMALGSQIEKAENYIIRNLIDNRLKFDMIATPEEHLALIVDNLNAREESDIWSYRVEISSSEKTVSYNHTTCKDAIVQLADIYETEFEVIGNEIVLGKVEYHKNDPLSLSYGKGNGLLSGVNRVSAGAPISRVYVQCSDRNISLKQYGAKQLHLPPSTSFRFDGEGFVDSGGVAMVTDSQGYSVQLSNAARNGSEASIDLTHIYPKRVGTISSVIYEYRGNYYSYSDLIIAYPELATSDEGWEHIYVHFCDSEIPEDLDYHACMLSNNEPLTCIFQSGSFTGREFNVTFHKEALTKEGEEGEIITLIPANRFEIERTTIDGTDMPARLFRPSEEDTYIIVNCYLPDEYIREDSTKTGASWDALKEAAKYLYEHKDATVTYKGEVDGLLAKRNWVNVGGHLKVGSYISFTDTAVQTSAILIRVVGLKQFVNNPYNPYVELSNDEIALSKSARLQRLINDAAHVAEEIGRTKQYSQRSFRDAKETAQMLIDAALDGFDEAISPIAVQTMQLLAGDERLQFYFVAGYQSTTRVDCPLYYDPETKTFKSDNVSYIQHLTLDIDDVTSSSPDARAVSDYHFWAIEPFESAVLADGAKKYYVYAVVEKDGNTGEFVLTETARDFEPSGEGEDDVYNLLVGILNSEREDNRSFAPLYGFTEILPGQITTDIIRSTLGESWINLLLNQFSFGNSSKYIAWNLPDEAHPTGDGVLRLKGVISQSQSGDEFPIATFRDAFSASTQYYYGDLVTYTDGSSYINIYEGLTPIGTLPTDTTYWKLYTKAGADAKRVKLSASSLYFTYANSEATSPTGDTSITVTATAQNIPSPTFHWEYYNGSQWIEITSGITTTGSVSELIIYHNFSGFTSNVLKLRCYCNNLSDNIQDSIALYKVVGGKDAPDILVADLDNEMEAVELSQAGKTTTSTSIVSHIQIFLGSTAQRITSITNSGRPSGISAPTITYNSGRTKATLTLTVPSNVALSTSTKITYTVNCAEGSKDVIFELLGVKQGEDGKSPMIYAITPSESVIVRDKDNIPDPAYITCKVLVKQGTSVTEDGLTKGTLYYYLDGSSTPNQYSANQQIEVGDGASKFHDKVRFEFIPTGSSTVVDRESVYVVDDGEESVLAGLDNPAMQFSGDNTHAYADSDTAEITVFRGATQLDVDDDYTIGTPHPKVGSAFPSGLNVSVSGNIVTVSVTTSLTQTKGDIVIPISVLNASETIELNLTISWTLSLKGDPGEQGPKGDTGAKLRGPTVWEAGKDYYAGLGTTGEYVFQDIVYYEGNGQYYVCTQNALGLNTPPPSDPTHWASGNNYQFVATKVFLSQRAKIENLQVTELTTENPDDEEAVIHIENNCIQVRDSSGAAKVTLTTEEFPTSSGSSSSISLSRKQSTVDDERTGADTRFFDVITTSAGTIRVTGPNNIVTLNSYNLIFTVPTWRSYLTSVNLVVFVRMRRQGDSGSGSVYRTFQGNITSSTSNHSITIPTRQVKTNFPTGTYEVIYEIYVVFNGTPSASDTLASLSYDIRSTSGTVTYTLTTSLIAINGAQLRYGTEGIKVTEDDCPKAIQGGVEYNMAALGSSIAGLSPKRIEFCTTYPSTLDDDVFYIKVS